MNRYYDKPVRVVIDTCVWVSAIRSNLGASYQILSQIGRGRFEFGMSVALFLEYQDTLLRTAKNGQSRLTPHQIDAILAALAHFGDEVPVYYRLRPNLRDPNDDMVFECAANYGASHIVTFNIKDFENAELKTYHVKAITPGELWETLKGEVNE